MSKHRGARHTERRGCEYRKVQVIGTKLASVFWRKRTKSKRRDTS